MFRWLRRRGFTCRNRRLSGEHLDRYSAHLRKPTAASAPEASSPALSVLIDPFTPTGMTPVGFTFDFARSRRIYPFPEISSGIIASTKPIPLTVPGATSLNFLVDFRGGVKLGPGAKRYGFEAGYKFLHISSAFTTAVNPGVDNNNVYIGFSLFR